MVRGVLATTVIALALGVNLSALEGQHGNGAQHGNSAAAHGASSSHSKTRTSTASPTLSPVQQKVQSHTQLANKLQSRLGPHVNVVNAASGFRNLGQFVAAVNVSHNLGIPFTQLKRDMVQEHMSLGQSIQDLRPRANSEREVQRAQTQTRQMMDSDDK